MNHTRRHPSVPAFALAFWGLSLALLLAGCSREPAPPSASAPPPPPAQSPPNLEPPSEVRPAPVQEQVVMVVRDDSGRHTALVARHQDQWQVMVDARPDPPFEFIFAETLKFSPNSAHPGYLALKGQKLAAVVDGQVKDQRDILAPGSRALKELLRQVDDQGVPPKVEVK